MNNRCFWFFNFSLFLSKLNVFSSKSWCKHEVFGQYRPKHLSIFLRNHIRTPFFDQNLMFLINLKVIYDQIVPKHHVNIKILMKRHHILTKIGIPATQNKNLDKMQSINSIIWKKSVYLFRAALFNLIYVLHKDVLFHRYLRKVDCSSFVLCWLLPLALPKVFLQQPLTVLTGQTRQAVYAIKQSIFNMMSMIVPLRSIFAVVVECIPCNQQWNSTFLHFH